MLTNNRFLKKPFILPEDLPPGIFSSGGRGSLGLYWGGNTRAAFHTAALSYFISQDADHGLNDCTAHWRDADVGQDSVRQNLILGPTPICGYVTTG